MSTDRNAVPDLSGESGRELHYTVPPRLSSAIHLIVDPSSVCSVGLEEDPEHRLRVVPNPEGLVRFHVLAPAATAQIARLAVECETDGHVSRHGIELRIDGLPTPDMPVAPERQAIRWRDDSRLRRPLSMSEMLSVSDEELLERHYPLRPSQDDAPRAFEAWRRVVAAPALEVEPALVQRPDVTHGLAQAGPSSSSNWSGFELREMPFMERFVGGEERAARFDWVTGTWKVPHIVGHAEGNAYSSLWIGLDGDGTSDLYQAGTEQDIVSGRIADITYSIASYYAWTEFLPQEPFENTISGFGVNPGDEIMAVCWIGDLGSAPKLDGVMGFTYIHNFGTGEFSIIQTPRGSTDVGGTEAEWIMERPTITVAGMKQPLPALADYGSAVVSGAYARWADSPSGTGFVPYQGSSNLQKTMFDSSGSVLSTVRALDAYSMEFHWGDPRALPLQVFPKTRLLSP